MRRFVLAALLFGTLSACDGGDGPCTDTRVAFLDPMPMQRITAADDVDPDMGMIQYEFVIEARCLAEGELVELYLLEPAESLYGGGAPDAMGIFRTSPTLIPGDNRFVLVTTESMTRSEELEVSVSF